MNTIYIQYHNENIKDKIVQIEQGNWIDLRAAETVEMKAGDFKIISLGISVLLPNGYEAHIAPRSSTFKKFGIIQTNSVGVVDHDYCGPDDIWGYPALAMRDTVIHEGDRICQFRIMPVMGDVDLVTVDHLSNKSRGGFGSTGVA